MLLFFFYFISNSNPCMQTMEALIRRRFLDLHCLQMSTKRALCIIWPKLAKGSGTIRTDMFIVISDILVIQKQNIDFTSECK